MKPILISHGPLDKPSEWPSLMVQSPPTVDVEGFQKQIDKIVGTTILNEPIVRLRWARECRKWVNIEWDAFGNATKGEFQQKYCAYRYDLPGDDYVEISPPRWVLEERFEPAQYEASWDASRYLNVPTDIPSPACRYCKLLDWIDPHKSEGVINICRHCGEMNLVPFVRRDMVGPAPRDGWYNLLYVIGVFSKHTKNKFGPWGGYRVPDQSDLTNLRRVISLRNKDAECNPHEPLSPAALAQARAWGLQYINEQRKAINERSTTSIT